MRRLVVMLLLALAAGCAEAVPQRADPEVPAFTSQSERDDAERATLPTDCAEVATVEEITTILSTVVTGKPQRVVGVPQDNIGRTARLDCYYGIPAGQPVAAAAVWIGLVSYVDEDSARQRLTNTVSDERDAGATATEVAVGTGTGTLLDGPQWMLVAQRGKTTTVVSVVEGMVRDDLAGALLAQLADLALTPR